MKKLLIAIAIALPIAMSSPVASAAPNKESDCERAKRQGKTCQITFGSGDDVEGGVATPDGDDVYGVMDAFFGNLIRLRLDFRKEIIAAVDRF
ncbi:MAG TPA: hypothetical protein VML75_01745 [Kofleriaceae bacterium]|nr:hypothetical protein [Kofleriaceae bacterium]